MKINLGKKSGRIYSILVCIDEGERNISSDQLKLNLHKALGFTKEIRNSVGSLLKKHAFSLVEEREKPAHFGNAWAVFQSPVLRLRFVRDGGRLVVDVAETGLSEQCRR